jgi:hypothetical protein
MDFGPAYVTIPYQKTTRRNHGRYRLAKPVPSGVEL